MLIAYLEKQQQNNAGEMALADLEVFSREAKKHYDEDEAFAERARGYVVKLQCGEEYCREMWSNWCVDSADEEIHAFRPNGREMADLSPISTICKGCALCGAVSTVSERPESLHRSLRDRHDPCSGCRPSGYQGAGVHTSQRAVMPVPVCKHPVRVDVVMCSPGDKAGQCRQPAIRDHPAGATRRVYAAQLLELDAPYRRRWTLLGIHRARQQPLAPLGWR